jgi:hypothetical protein
VRATYTRQSAQNPTAAEPVLRNGTVVTRGKLSYRITDSSKRTVWVCDVSKNAKKVTIPATISYDGKRFAVNGIARGAFKGSHVKTITVKTKKLSKKSVRGCFKGAAKLKVVKVPKQKKSQYRAFFKKSRSGRSVKIR